MQLQLVDVQRMARQNQRLAAKDRAQGDSHTADLRRADYAQKADFIIEVNVRGRYLGKEALFGSLPQHKFSLSADLRAVRPDTGDVLVSVPMPGREDLESGLEAPDMAARDLVHKMLPGGLGEKYPGAMVLFRRIFASWVAELDLGTVMRLELAQLTDPEHDRLLKHLEQAEKITATWPREFDPKGLTIIDAESRLDVAGLKAEVVKALGGAFEFTGATRNYLQFARAQGRLPTAGSPSSVNQEQGSSVGVQRGTSDSERGTSGRLPPWAWALIGAGIVLLLVAVFMLGKKSK